MQRKLKLNSDKYWLFSFISAALRYSSKLSNYPGSNDRQKKEMREESWHTTLCGGIDKSCWRNHFYGFCTNSFATHLHSALPVDKHEGTKQESIKTNMRQLFSRGWKRMKSWSHFILRFYEACNKWIRCQLKNHIKWFRSIHTRAFFIHGSLASWWCCHIPERTNEQATTRKESEGAQKKYRSAYRTHVWLTNEPWRERLRIHISPLSR